MTKISSKTAYPKKKPISSDYFVGTDSEDFNKTVNFGFEEVAGLVNDLNGTPILNYLFSTSPYLSTEVLLEGRFLSVGNELSTPLLTKLYVNKFNNSGSNLAELYLFLQANATDFYLKLRNSNNQNNAVYFDISSIENFPDYFILNIAIFKENEFLPLLENLNVYFFDFELKATSAGTSDPLKLDKSTYTGNAQDLDDRLDILESQTDVDNAFIVKPTFSLLSNVLTIGSLGRWRLNGVAYTNPASVPFPITFSATGKTRLVYFVPNNTNGFTQVSGIETLGLAIAPQLPNEGLYVTYVLVSDSGVGEPIIPPAVVIPNIEQVLTAGFSTKKPMWFWNILNSKCLGLSSESILFQKLESVFNFIRVDNTTQSYNIQLPNKLGGAEETFAMVSDLTNKVDKITGKGLSTEDYTTSEKNKLASIDATHYLPPLQTTVQLSALPQAGISDKARVYVETDLSDYFYDVTASSGDIAPNDQVGGTGFWRKVSVGGETAASIKVKYESNADTNAFTNALKAKLDSITEIFTTALKSAYDGSVTWISTNGANVISAYTWVTTNGASLISNSHAQGSDDETTASLKPKILETLGFACSDETAALTTGLKVTFRMPYAMTLSSVRISLATAATIGSFIVDVKQGGVSIFSTLVSIDATELTSTTATTPAVLSTTELTDDSLMTIHVTQIGSGDAGKGLKLLFIGNKL